MRFVSNLGTDSQSGSDGANSDSAQAQFELDVDLDMVMEQWGQARRFAMPDLTENEIVSFIERILVQHGAVPVGKVSDIHHYITLYVSTN